MSRETSAREWFDSAERDRLAAKHLLDAGDYEACAFHCQQAVEKLLKATIVKQGGKRPPYLHNLRGLLEMVSGIEIDKDVEEAVSSINSYYIGACYPIDAVDPNSFKKPVAESAIGRTEQIFKWFSTKISFASE